MMVSSEELSDLKNIVIQEIAREFETHLTGNLLNTIYVEYEIDQIRIVIRLKHTISTNGSFMAL